MREEKAPIRLPSVARLSPNLVWLAWIVWLPFLALDAVSMLRSQARAAVTISALASMGLFALAYGWATLRNVRDLFYLSSAESQRKSRGNWPVAVLMAALSALIDLLGKSGGFGVISGFIYTSAYIGGAFSWRRAAAMNAAVLGFCLAMGAAFNLAAHLMTLFLIPVVSFMVMLVRWSLTAGKDLRAAQEEISRLAVSEERLRIARDLHDLLGHTLSLISLKSELARRLISVSPERADKEIGDVEAAARSMLQDVREALSLYRRPELERELSSLRDLLEAAGISLKTEVEKEALLGLEPAQEEVLAWTLREGVTNLVRHSRASSCVLRLRRERGRVAVELVDDGGPREPTEGERASPGAGLAGLKRRAEDLGGELEAGYLEGGGFRLRVSVPSSSGKAATA